MLEDVVATLGPCGANNIQSSRSEKQFVRDQNTRGVCVGDKSFAMSRVFPASLPISERKLSQAIVKEQVEGVLHMRNGMRVGRGVVGTQRAPHRVP